MSIIYQLISSANQDERFILQNYEQCKFFLMKTLEHKLLKRYFRKYFNPLFAHACFSSQDIFFVRCGGIQFTLKQTVANLSKPSHNFRTVNNLSKIKNHFYTISNLFANYLIEINSNMYLCFCQYQLYFWIKFSTKCYTAVHCAK